VPKYAGQHPVVLGDPRLKGVPLNGYGGEDEGEVTAVDEERGLVTISLGARQGIKGGDRFEVFTLIPVPQGPPLKEVHGVIEVVYLVGPDRAVCRIVELSFPIEVHDRVRPVKEK